jgi:hypothetical protein
MGWQPSSNHGHTNDRSIEPSSPVHRLEYAAPMNEQARTSEFTINGDQVVAKVKELIAEGNVRRVIIKNEDGRTMLEVPLTIGLIGAALMPVLAAIGAAAALATRCTIVVEREGPPAGREEPPATA